ncbi:hypothetical protein [Marmoricola endophyticus]|uniref:hypothetical protein n=1 Tax=Marmoricola endophyticus TaxID=2040280 RepID=UPI001669D9C3|nr:hypothetical protein [Marmoricola endophyticus]
MTTVQRTTAGPCVAEPKRGIACSRDGRTAYRYRPGDVQRVSLRSARSHPGTIAGRYWQVDLSATASGAVVLARLTTALAATERRLLMLTPRTRALIAELGVTDPIRDGELQITGQLEATDTNEIVNQITSSHG